MVLSQDLKWKDCSRYLRGSTALIHTTEKAGVEIGGEHDSMGFFADSFMFIFQRESHL